MRLRRRETPFSLYDFWDCILAGLLVLAAIIIAIVTLIGLGGFAIFSYDENNHAENNEGIERLLLSYGDDAGDLSEATRAKRKALAANAIELETSYEADESSYYGYNESEMSKLTDVARTGEPIDLDTRRTHFSEFLGFVFSPLVIGVVWFAFWTASYFAYLDICSRRHRVADMPWKRGWPWLITIFGGPVWWVSMVVSGILLKRDPPLPVPQPAGMPAVVDVDDVDTTDNWAGVELTSKSYVSAPRSAREMYTTLRTEGAAKQRRHRLQAIDDELESQRETMREHGEELKAAQVTMNELASDRKLLLAAEEEVGDDSATTGEAGEEFDRIMKLPGILAVQVVNDQIRLIVRATYRYNGQLYDLGDWQMDFGVDSYSISAKELRSGVKSTWRHNYPVYRLGGGRFCFGVREYVINDHLRKSQYLEAIALAVECLNSVNPEDKGSVPKAFHKRKEESTNG